VLFYFNLLTEVFGKLPPYIAAVYHIGNLFTFFRYHVFSPSVIRMDLFDIMTLDNADPSLSNADGSSRPPVFVTLVPIDFAAIAHVRLPCFWRHSPQQWFTHAEAIFQTNRIRADLHGFLHRHRGTQLS
jgi:hypothetical protein